MKKTTVWIDPELLKDVEESIAERIRAGKNCGGLRLSDSHEMRIKYLYEFWKNEVMFNGKERREAAKKLEDARRKAILDEAFKKLEGDL